MVGFMLTSVKIACRKFDLNEDGKLDIDEFYAFCEELCVGITNEQVETSQYRGVSLPTIPPWLPLNRAQLHQLPSGGSDATPFPTGTVSMCMPIKDPYAPPNHRPPTHDLQHHTITAAARAQVQALLERYDNDDSGNIAFAEFSKAMLGR